MPVNPSSTVYDRILDMVPSAIDKLIEGTEYVKNTFKAKKEEKNGMTAVPTPAMDDETDEIESE